MPPSECSHATETRLANGVLTRMDGKGDAWADEHRKALGSEFLMTDLDAMFGHISFGHNTGERLFLEYAPDSWENRHSAMRQFALVALFDRKASDAAAYATRRGELGGNFYRWLCRSVSDKQPRPARFFYVIGGDCPPWHLDEIDTSTGERIGNRHTIYQPSDWREVWDAVGLQDLRRSLIQWLRTKPEAQ